MAHNIGKMFYVGDRPWHRLGARYESALRIGDAIKAGCLDYTVSLRPLAVAGEDFSEVSQRMAVVRDDRKPGEVGRVLGVVHPNFKLLQNAEGAALFDSLLGKGEPVYHTGGYLKQGEVVWLQARLPKPIAVSEGDQVDTYLLFSNSHDGSYPIDIRLSTVRVVCNNTLNIALKDKDTQKVFRRGHSGSLEVVKEEAAAFFESILHTQASVQASMQKLAKAECDDKAFAGFLEKLMPIPTKPVTAATNGSVSRAYETRRAGIQAARAGVLSVFKEGYADDFTSIGRQPPAGPNWWGALNSMTAWVDHVQVIEGDRLAHRLFGGGDDLKSKAYKLALENADTPSAQP